jgi:hypothetical protein
MDNGTLIRFEQNASGPWTVTAARTAIEVCYDAGSVGIATYPSETTYQLIPPDQLCAELKGHLGNNVLEAIQANDSDKETFSAPHSALVVWKQRSGHL